MRSVYTYVSICFKTFNLPLYNLYHFRRWALAKRNERAKEAAKKVSGLVHSIYLSLCISRSVSWSHFLIIYSTVWQVYEFKFSFIHANPPAFAVFVAFIIIIIIMIINIVIVIVIYFTDFCCLSSLLLYINHFFEQIYNKSRTKSDEARKNDEKKEEATHLPHSEKYAMKVVITKLCFAMAVFRAFSFLRSFPLDLSLSLSVTDFIAQFHVSDHLWTWKNASDPRRRKMVCINTYAYAKKYRKYQSIESYHFTIRPWSRDSPHINTNTNNYTDTVVSVRKKLRFHALEKKKRK